MFLQWPYSEQTAMLMMKLISVVKTTQCGEWGESTTHAHGVFINDVQYACCIFTHKNTMCVFVISIMVLSQKIIWFEFFDKLQGTSRKNIELLSKPNESWVYLMRKTPIKSCLLFLRDHTIKFHSRSKKSYAYKKGVYHCTL